MKLFMSLRNLFPVLLLCLTILFPAQALEATFTAAPDKDTGSTDGPLPLSQNQRNQLLQLDQQIAQSPDPQATLIKVAESNGMSPQELGDLLMRNRRDMQMAGGGGGAPSALDSLPRRMFRLMGSIVLLGAKSANAHPRSATMISIALFSILYVMYSAPRNGVLIPSKGITTLLPPPTEYLSNYLLSDKFDALKESKSKLKKSVLFSVFDEDAVDDFDDKGKAVPKLSKKEKKEISTAVVAKKIVPFEVLLPTEEELELLHEQEKGKDVDICDEDLMEMIENKAWQDAVDLAFNSAESIITARRFSEFVGSSSTPLTFLSRGNKKDKALLALKSMGSLNRYGLQPLRVASEEKSEDSLSVFYYTLQGGHFDGELKVTIEKGVDEDDEPTITVTVTLLFPKGGKSIHTKLASNMCSMMANSITTSALTTARQNLSRKLQSSIYRGKAKSRATEKRHIAFENIQKMEEMAADRRRRWQRANPGAGGGYRPSGHGRPSGGPKFGPR